MNWIDNIRYSQGYAIQIHGQKISRAKHFSWTKLVAPTLYWKSKSVKKHDGFEMAGLDVFFLPLNYIKNPTLTDNSCFMKFHYQFRNLQNCDLGYDISTLEQTFSEFEMSMVRIRFEKMIFCQIFAQKLFWQTIRRKCAIWFDENLWIIKPLKLMRNWLYIKRIFML